MVLPVASAVLPRTGILSWGFQRSDHLHNGVDIGAKEGAPVRAAASGRVRHATHAWQQGFSGYGRVVVLEHPIDRVWTLYAHLGDVLVVPDQEVQAGDQIGTVGRSQFLASDHSSMLAPGKQHLHFEVASRPYPMPNDEPRLDPVAWLEDGSRVTSDPDELLTRLRRVSDGAEFLALIAVLGGVLWLARKKGS